MSADLIPCSNCGRLIDNLETHHVWDEQVVCTQCRRLLEDEWGLSTPRSSPARSTNLPTAMQRPKRRKGDQTGLIAVSIVILVLSGLAAAGGAPGLSNVLIVFWVLLLIARLIDKRMNN